MKKAMLILGCLCMAAFASTAFADVGGFNATPGSWTSTGSYSSTITLSDPGGDTAIDDVTVQVLIDHTWSSDVSMSLSDGTTTVIFNANQGSSNDYSGLGGYLWNDAGGPADPGGSPIPFGIYETDSPLNGAFASSDATWTLTIMDTTGGDGAIISGWGLNLMTSPATPAVPEPTSCILLGLFGTAAVMRRRKR